MKKAAVDNMTAYRDAVAALSNTDKMSAEAILLSQHRAILALARAGATDFAQSEYERYGLDRVTDHEDIMALPARLAKDRYLRDGHTGDAKRSARLYEAAFQSTDGYYSGINSATMSRLSDADDAIVLARAQAVLDRLGAVEGESDEDRYYIEATRAEAQYILGNETAARTALQHAVDYDPLNYNAHASTYRQMRLLTEANGKIPDWLKRMRPPLSVHFAGHIFGRIKDEASLIITLSDMIQRHDIGFGYGALAAGSDIVFAECLLNEGGTLNIILPVEEALFVEKSVQHLGEDWTSRYEACRAQAASIRILSTETVWPNPVLNNYAARIAMGAAVARADELSSEAAQILIWDERIGRSLTGQHALDWRAANKSGGTERLQIVVPYPDRRGDKGPRPDHAVYESIVKFAVSDGQLTEFFTDPLQAMDSAQARRRPNKRPASASRAKIGVHTGYVQDNDTAALEHFAKMLSRTALPDSVLISEEMSNTLALMSGASWETSFMGTVGGTSNRQAYCAKRIRH